MRLILQSRFSTLTFLLAIAACGGRASKDGTMSGGAGDGDGNSSSDPDPEPRVPVVACEMPELEPLESTSGTLEVPLVPLDCLEHAPIFSGPEAASSDGRWEALNFGPVPLALAADYPTELELDLGTIGLTQVCGIATLDGHFNLTSLQSPTDGLHVDESSGGRVTLSFAEEGDYEVRIEGDFTFDQSDVACDSLTDGFLSLGLDVVFEVREVHGTELLALTPGDECNEGGLPLLISGHPFQSTTPSLTAYPTDATGARFWTRSALQSHQVAVTVHAEPGTRLSIDDAELGLSALVAEGPHQQIAFSAQGEELGSVELLAREDVDGWTVEWTSEQGRLYETLTSGETYPRSDPSFHTLHAFPQFMFGGRPICTKRAVELAELHSDTPDICRIDEALGAGLNAEVLGPGTCILRLIAPDMNGEDGLEEVLEVEFLDAVE